MHPYVRWFLIFTIVGIIVAPLAVAGAYTSAGTLVLTFVHNTFIFLGALGNGTNKA